MSTIYETRGFAQTTTPMRWVLGLLDNCLRMLCELQQRNAMRGAMYLLSDRELEDIGATRGEIDHVVRSRLADSRGARSARH